MADQAVTRKLAVILSADVVGYSRLMGADEPATVQTLNAHRAVFKDLITAHQGRVVDTAGDSVLAEFASVVEAVSCAVAVQQALQTRNETLPPARRMHFRLGLNLGDVIAQADGSIYGVLLRLGGC
jgi:adenylate cyclase